MKPATPRISKPIKVDTKEQFDRLCERIDKEVSHTIHHWKLLNDLHKSLMASGLEYSLSPTFWTLTLRAHYDTVLTHLSRVYDTNGQSLGLSRMLQTIQSNPAFYPEDDFRFSVDELCAEIQSVSIPDPDVNALKAVRDQALAHLEADFVVKDNDVVHRELPNEIIERLIKRASAITSKYSLIFTNGCYGEMAGLDDFERVLVHLRDGMKRRSVKLNTETRKLEKRLGKTPHSS